MKQNPIKVSSLTSKQREAYHFQKISALLADYGYQTIKLSDDWCGADFIAQHLDGTFRKIQLKGRLAVGRKYEGKELWIAFPNNADWYVFPHDAVLERLLSDKKTPIRSTYVKTGGYSFPGLSKELIQMLEAYRIKAPA